MHSACFCQHDWQLRKEGGHPFCWTKLTNQSNRCIRAPRQHVEEYNYYGNFCDLYFCFRFLLIGFDIISFHLCRHFLHFTLVFFQSSNNQNVGQRNYNQGSSKAEEVEEKYICSIVWSRGKVVKSARGLKTFGDVAAPAEERGQRGTEGPHPDNADHHECSPPGHVASSPQRMCNGVVTVDADCWQSGYRHQTENSSN